MKRCPDETCGAKCERTTEFNEETEKWEPHWKCQNCRYMAPVRKYVKNKEEMTPSQKAGIEYFKEKCDRYHNFTYKEDEKGNFRHVRRDGAQHEWKDLTIEFEDGRVLIKGHYGLVGDEGKMSILIRDYFLVTITRNGSIYRYGPKGKILISHPGFFVPHLDNYNFKD